MADVDNFTGDVYASLSPALKTVYEPELNKAIKDQTGILDELETSSDGIGGGVMEGLYVQMTRQTAVNNSAGGRLEAAAWPAAGRSEFNNPKTTVTSQFSVGSVTGIAAARATNDDQTMVKILRHAVNEVREGAKRSLARQIQLSSDGAIATIAGGGVSGTGPWTLTLGTTPEAKQVFLGRFLRKNTLVSFGSVTSGVGTEEAGVARVTRDAYDVAGTIKVDVAAYSGSPDPDAADVIFLAGTANAQLQGFNQIISDNTNVFEQVDPTVDTTWQSVRVDGGGDPISVDLLAQFRSQLDFNGPDAEQNLIFVASKQSERALWSELSANLYYTNPNNMEADPQKGIIIPGGGRLRSFHEALKGRVRAIDKRHLKFSQAGDWAFENVGGSNFLLTSRVDAREIVLKRYLQLVTDAKNAHGEIYNLDDTQLY